MPDDEELLTGGCACGGVRFALDAPLEDGVYCHCNRCQRRSGTAASANARVPAAAFRVTAGRELITEWAPPPPGSVKAFCSVCGGHLYARSSANDAVVAVRLGALDADPGVRPGYRQWVSSAVAWEPIPDDGLPRHEGPRA